MSKIVACVPVLESMKPKMVIDFLGLCLSGRVQSYVIVEGTLLPQARNDLINLIYKHKPGFSHVLFIDADQCGFNYKHLDLLLECDKDIVSGITAMSRKDKNGNRPCTFSLHPDQSPDVQVAETLFTGLFFTLIKREVFDALKIETNLEPIWFTNECAIRETYEEEKKVVIEDAATRIKKGWGETEKLAQVLIEFGENKNDKMPIVGEDIAFCRRARAAGFKIYVHAMCLVGHISEDVYFPLIKGPE